MKRTNQQLGGQDIDVLSALADYYEDLDDLCSRLQQEYNGGEPFEQDPQDRIALCALLDTFDNLQIASKEVLGGEK